VIDNESDGQESNASRLRQERRLARQQNLQRLQAKNAELFAHFDQITRKRWAFVKLVADHGYLEQSKKLEAHAKALQERCDANAALLGGY